MYSFILSGLDADILRAYRIGPERPQEWVKSGE